jgi:hypothetical protein
VIDTVKDLNLTTALLASTYFLQILNKFNKDSLWEKEHDKDLESVSISVTTLVTGKDGAVCAGMAP